MATRARDENINNHWMKSGSPVQVLTTESERVRPGICDRGIVDPPRMGIPYIDHCGGTWYIHTISPPFTIMNKVRHGCFSCCLRHNWRKSWSSDRHTRYATVWSKSEENISIRRSAVVVRGVTCVCVRKCRICVSLCNDTTPRRASTPEYPGDRSIGRSVQSGRSHSFS